MEKMNAIPFPSERFIEDFIFSKMVNDRQCPLSGDSVELCLRQHEIKGYGITDLIRVKRSGYEFKFTVVELKNDVLKESHFSQLSRYMVGLTRQLQRYNESCRLPFCFSVYGNLAGPFEVGANDLVFMMDYLQSISVYALSLTMESGFVASEIRPGWFRQSEDLKGGRTIIRELRDADMLLPQPDLKLVSGSNGGFM